ncbi:MAG: FG-GAP repeat domain-containing protein, partial [Planctomycetota bacterium]
MSKKAIWFLLPAAVLVLAVGLHSCGGKDEPQTVAEVKPEGGLAFAFVDVAPQMGFLLRNRTGTDRKKNFILEAMPPGIAVADYDGDGWMDLYVANGNLIWRYHPGTRKITLLPPEEEERNELFWNKGGKRFERGAKAAGVDDNLWGYGAVTGDIDNDGDPDIYQCNWGTNRLYLNDGKGRFTDVAAQAGVAGNDRDWSTGCCLFDYDRDGDLDLFVCQFCDIHGVLADPTITTVDEDGKPNGRSCEWKGLEVYCGPTGLIPLNDVLYRNLLMETGELKFEDVTKKAGVWFDYDDRSATVESRGPFYGFQPVAWDIDRDGWPDVYVANDSVANNCWINQKDGTFKDMAMEMSLAMGMEDFQPQASMGLGIGDLNKDGLQDILVAHFSHDTFNMLIAEYLEERKMTVFNEKASKSGLRQMTYRALGWGTEAFDPDHDGDLDIFFANGHVYPEVDQFPAQETTYEQTNMLILMEDPRRLKLRDVSDIAGPAFEQRRVSRAAAEVDFDNDGDPDIALINLNDTSSLYRCDLDRKSAPRHWIRVRLRGDPKAKIPNDPAGAEITV